MQVNFMKVNFCFYFITFTGNQTIKYMSVRIICVCSKMQGPCELAIICISDFTGDNIYCKMILLHYTWRERALNSLDELFIVISYRPRHIICYSFKPSLNIRRGDRIIALHKKPTYRYKVFLGA